MRFEDITQEWIDNNKEMLHEYFFKVIVGGDMTSSYKGIDMSMSYIIKSRIKYNRYKVTIMFDNDSTFFIIHNYLGTNYSLENFLSYLREEKINLLIYDA